MKLSGRLSPTVTGTLAVLRLLPRVSGGMTAALTAAVILATAMPLGFTIVTGILVGSVPAAVRSGLDSSAGHHTLVLLGIAAGLIVGQRVLAPFQASLSEVFGREVDLHLQERVMAAVARPAGIGHLEDPEMLDLMQTAQGVGGGEYKPGQAVASLASLLPSWLQALGSAAILFGFRWWLAVLWLVMWPVVLYYLQREYIQVGKTASGEAGALRRAGYFRDLALLPLAAKEVRIWGMLGWLTGRFGDHWHAAMGPIWDTRSPGRKVVWLSTGAVTAVNLFSFGLLASAAASGELALGALTVFIYATINAGSFRAFDDTNSNLAYAATSVPSLLTLEERLAALPTGDGVTLPPGSPRDGIRLEGVRFRYPNQEDDTLAGIDLALPAGRSVAIVGANGAGKTTLVKLLCRMYEPAGGRITVDGIDLSTVDAVWWRRHVAAIFQDFSRYHLSVRDNIALGAIEHAGDTARLLEAARRAGALNIIEELPHGWDTVLSRQYTEGTDLSGGQWQRIALARALFAVDAGARVLILDEPTANLDVRAEAEIYDRFLELTAGLTTVLISHRFSTVRRADQIVVIEDGIIVERGSHDELMARGGTYAHMFGLQAERFVTAAVPEAG